MCERHGNEAAADAPRKRLVSKGPASETPGGGSSADEIVRELYAAHGRELLSYVQRLGASHHDAEEVVQETMLRAWQNARLLDPQTGSIRGWLYTVARHILVDQHRVRTPMPTGMRPPEAESAVSDHQEVVVERISVLNALADLSAEHRVVVVEVYYRGRAVESVARSLGIPSGTVRSRLFYALRHLRRILKSRRFDEDDVTDS
jgi:RNA polymerase sigma-70 factor, ECF subfamily